MDCVAVDLKSRRLDLKSCRFDVFNSLSLDLESTWLDVLKSPLLDRNFRTVDVFKSPVLDRNFRTVDVSDRCWELDVFDPPSLDREFRERDVFDIVSFYGLDVFDKISGVKTNPYGSLSEIICTSYPDSFLVKI